MKIRTTPEYCKTKQTQAGTTLIELIVGLAIFAILASAFLSVYSILTRTVKLAREKTILASLSSNYMEVARNMSYSQIGTATGNPPGSLPDNTNPIQIFENGTTYKIYYEVTYIHDPADPSATSTPDYKQVKMNILNTTTNAIENFTTTIVPQGITGGNNLGALWVQVVNSQGQPVSGANIHIQSPPINPTMVLDRSSDSGGNWIEVGLPPGANTYRIVVTKSGYSTDQTSPITQQNPNPTKPDATVAATQVTKVSFAIDQLSNLTIKTQNQLCQAINGVGAEVKSSKLIGTNPNIAKFDQILTSGPSSYPSGQILLSNIEWDTYTPMLSTSSAQTYNVFGTSPIQQIDVLPGTNQTFTLILGPAASNSLLVIVKDASTLAPLEGATVELQKGGSQPQDYFGSTGGSVWVQNDWSGGSGFANWSTSTPNTYYSSTGLIYVNNGSNDVELQKIGGHYMTNSTSTVESSSFDTGTSQSNYTTLTWLPPSQSASTTLVFQLAANNDNATWTYVGPDGTSNSYYTTPGSNISSALDNNHYIRYKVYLLTMDDKKTPVLSSLQINYVSGCFTPGQYMFNNITPSQGNSYTLTVTLPGYQTQVLNGVNISGNQVVQVLMPQ